MARERDKYAPDLPQEAPTARGPSWRDVWTAMAELKALVGYEYQVLAWASYPQNSKHADSIVWYLKAAFDRPWASEESKYGQYQRFPCNAYKTVPALLLALIDREEVEYLQWKEPLKQGSLF